MFTGSVKRVLEISNIHFCKRKLQLRPDWNPQSQYLYHLLCCGWFYRYKCVISYELCDM